MNITPASFHLPAGGVTNRLAFWFAAIVTVVVFLVGIYAPYFIVDSWSYLELSKSIFTDFYRFNTLRQFESLSPYSNTFPPLWPVLLAIVRQVIDLGIYTGYLLNCLICIGLLAALMRLFRKLGLPGWAGTVCYLSLFGFIPFLWDALGAKTMALSLTLLACTLLLLFGKSTALSRLALAGLLMGLACLNRFDALPTACVIGLAFAVRVHRSERRLGKTIASLAVYCLALGAVLSPWALYGMKHFGKPFPSDNTRQMALAHGGNVLDYYQTPPPSDLAQDPVKWVAALVSDKAQRVARGFYENALSSAIPILFVAVLVVWGAARPPALPVPAARFIVLALVLIPVILLPAALVGYSDSRYYSGPVFLLLAVLLTGLVSLSPRAWNSRRIAVLLLVAALPLCPSVVQPLLHNRSRLFAPRQAMLPRSPTREMRQVTEAVRRDAGGQPHRLILTTGHIESVKYGALTGEPTAVMPRLVGGTFAAFARDWHITHLYDPPQRPMISFTLPPVADPAIMMRAINTPGVELVPLDLPGLYRIRLTETPGTLPQAVAAHGDYWMYLGAYTSRGAKGIYLYKFHAATGKVEPAGIAAGRLWASNSDALSSSLPRIFAQIRAEWPDVKRILHGVQDPTFVALHPNGRYLYTADSTQAGTVSAFQINPSTGKLTMLNSKSSAGSLPAFVTVDQTGKNLLVANYGGTVAVLPIDGAGRLRDAVSIIQHRGQGADQALQPHPHSIYVSPDNRFAIVMDAGLDEVLVYRFDADKGTLTPHDPPFLKLPGTAPRHFSFHPNGIFAYAIGEKSSITTMRWDGRQGVFTPLETVSTLPPDFHGVSGAAEVLVHPSGRFLYGSNRGHESVAVFTIDPAQGTLTPIQYIDTQGKQPSNLGMDPAGNYLFAANAFSSNVVQFQIDWQTGRLTPTGYALSIPSPAGLNFALSR